MAFKKKRVEPEEEEEFDDQDDEEEFEDDEAEESEVQKVKNSVTGKAASTQTPAYSNERIEKILVNHEQRLNEIEATLFRLRSI